MRHLRLLATLLIVLLGLACGARPAWADSKPSPPTFASVIDRAVFVALADVHLTGATTELRIERVFKGDAAPLLTYTTSPTDVPLSDGERVVIALRQNGLDPRGGAIAWEVAA